MDFDGTKVHGSLRPINAFTSRKLGPQFRARINLWAVYRYHSPCAGMPWIRGIARVRLDDHNRGHIA
jgi:hypothetical protein